MSRKRATEVGLATVASVLTKLDTGEVSPNRVRLPPPLPNYPREAVMDAIAEFILLAVYCLTVSILVLLSRPVRWAIRRVVGAFR